MKAVITAAKRTPLARQNGLLKNAEPHDLAASLIKHLAKPLNGILDEVILGNVVGPGGNIARLSALAAGLPASVSGMTIDRQCSAGLEAIRTACCFVQTGAGSCYIAGGTESASLSPFPGRARFSPDEWGDPDMGIAAELTADRYRITRKMQDDYALLSYKRSESAFENGYYDDEILPFQGLAADESMIRKRLLENIIERAKPVFKKGGTVTAANSCGIHDGASAVVVMNEEKAEALRLQPVLRFVDSAVAGVDPNVPQISPVPAIQKLLKKRNLSVKDIDLFEINEAFAVKIAACAGELGLPYHKLNVRGGALALGHPYGASGAVLVTRLFYEAARRDNLKYAVAAIGSGGGVGIALLFEKIV
ncbi:acetyl-CoA C-acyltransferase [Bacillus paralicheniformis]|uniref:acetyl-CoA C-acyltransferase n=1 Tax=Bacillus paralicheniformis TaxID=1648923 RepID=UPI00298C670C|nr:acetyl-CoA C-acyltransferase [Bacillus paralicheniformis]MDW6054660.1 acetyl-CoA C-acyltransferase [Bacillus paralicheniformis]